MSLETGTIIAILIFILAVWSIVWKGFALWISAREDKKFWFVPLLVLNTAGILEIIYIFFFSVSGKKYIDGWKKHRAHKKADKISNKKSPKTPKVEDEEIV